MYTPDELRSEILKFIPLNDIDVKIFGDTSYDDQYSYEIIISNNGVKIFNPRDVINIKEYGNSVNVFCQIIPDIIQFLKTHYDIQYHYFTICVNDDYNFNQYIIHITK